MRITEMHIQGPAGSAAIRRPREGLLMEVEIKTTAGSRVHQVQADDREDLWSMAECLQQTLDGVPGCGGDIRSYFMPLQLMSDL